MGERRSRISEPVEVLGCGGGGASVFFIDGSPIIVAGGGGGAFSQLFEGIESQDNRLSERSGFPIQCF